MSTNLTSAIEINEEVLCPTTVSSLFILYAINAYVMVGLGTRLSSDATASHAWSMKYVIHNPKSHARAYLTHGSIAY